MKTEKIIIGVLAGVAVGALLGVLFAPDKGSETRKKIAKKGTDTVDDLKLQFDELFSSLAEKVEAGKENLTDLFEKGESRLAELKKEAKKNMHS